MLFIIVGGIVCWFGLGLISAMMVGACYPNGNAPLWLKVAAVVLGPISLIGLAFMLGK